MIFFLLVLHSERVRTDDDNTNDDYTCASSHEKSIQKIRSRNAHMNRKEVNTDMPVGTKSGNEK